MSAHGDQSDQAKQINRKLETTLSPIKMHLYIFVECDFNVTFENSPIVSKDFPYNVNQ